MLGAPVAAAVAVLEVGGVERILGVAGADGAVVAGTALLAGVAAAGAGFSGRSSSSPMYSGALGG